MRGREYSSSGRYPVETAPLLLAVMCAAGWATAGTGEVRTNAHPVPGQYIVVLARGSEAVGDPSGVRATAVHLLSLHGGETVHVYERVLPGFSARLTEKQARAVADYLRTQHRVHRLSFWSSRLVKAVGVGVNHPPVPETNPLPAARIELLVFVPE